MKDIFESKIDTKTNKKCEFYSHISKIYILAQIKEKMIGKSIIIGKITTFSIFLSK